MRYLLLPSIIAMLATPAFAASSLTCDASGIGATTPNARMKASWSPTVYNIEWYDDDGTLLNVQSSAQTCAYGNTLVLPQANPTKVGYTFIGWEKEEQPTCTIPEVLMAGHVSDSSCLDLTNDFDIINEYTGHTNCSNGGYTAKASNYGITKPGQWGISVEGYGGYVIGETSCNSTPGTWATIGTPDTSSDGQYCWCKATHYTDSGGNQCTLSNSAWAFYTGYTSTTECLFYCTYWCLSNLFWPDDLRAAVFGGNVAQ